MARLGQGGGWSFIKLESPCPRTRNPISVTSLMIDGIVGGRNSSKKRKAMNGEPVLWTGEAGSVRSPVRVGWRWLFLRQIVWPGGRNRVKKEKGNKRTTSRCWGAGGWLGSTLGASRRGGFVRTTIV